jgi:hypothetical protein
MQLQVTSPRAPPHGVPLSWRACWPAQAQLRWSAQVVARPLAPGWGPAPWRLSNGVLPPQALSRGLSEAKSIGFALASAFFCPEKRKANDGRGGIFRQFPVARAAATRFMSVPLGRYTKMVDIQADPQGVGSRLQIFADAPQCRDQSSRSQLYWSVLAPPPDRGAGVKTGAPRLLQAVSATANPIPTHSRGH